MRFVIWIFLLFAVESFSEIDFSSLIYDYSRIPDLVQYQARDHAKLSYRYYPSPSNNLMIILHGSGYHSRYLYKLAKTITHNQIAQVVTPDLRGHGPQALKRGDIDYIGQLDDDLDDLVQFCIATYSPKKIFVAGHSSGGGLALRLMGNKMRHQADAYILLAPYFAHDAPTTNAKSNWAKPALLKVIFAHMLNGFGLHWLDHSVTIKFNLPEAYRDGSETLAYTHALITSFSPSDYERDLRNTTKKTLVVVGEDDEAMNASAYQKVLPQNASIELTILPRVHHMGIVTNEYIAGVIGGWLNRTDGTK